MVKLGGPALRHIASHDIPVRFINPRRAIDRNSAVLAGPAGSRERGELDLLIEPLD